MEFICTSTEPIVQTVAGKLRGYRLNGTYTFLGIKYADAERFQMPKSVAPWEGVKDALAYGYIAPLMGREYPFGDLRVPHRYWPQDENCQYLNVWTQSLDSNAKRPVMVWIHGGGFASGSSIEMVAYDGDNLSKYGDTVVVSINHRLNILGYLDVSAYGDKYANSGNVGIADLVEALEWVQDNIEQFGGDPTNVTVFGQSGGGGKIQVLLQTPAAAGLFQKAILQSGVIDFGPNPTPDGHKRLVGDMLAELGISTDEMEKFEKVPYAELVRAYNAVAPKLREDGIDVGWAPMPGNYYLGDPRKVGFTDFAKNVAQLVGSNIAEMPSTQLPPKKDELSEEEKVEFIRKKYGDASDKLIAMFKEAYPNKNLVDLLVFDTAFRAPNLEYLDKLTASTDVDSYCYMFTLDLPINDGTPAWHCAEMPFVFHNTDKVAISAIPDVTERLEQQMSSAWLNFARTGDPNNRYLPKWEAYKPENSNTMIFDAECEIKSEYDRDLVKLCKMVAPFRRFR